MEGLSRTLMQQTKFHIKQNKLSLTLIRNLLYKTPVALTKSWRDSDEMIQQLEKMFLKFLENLSL